MSENITSISTYIIRNWTSKPTKASGRAQSMTETWRRQSTNYISTRETLTLHGEIEPHVPPRCPRAGYFDFEIPMKYSSGESCGQAELWFEVQRKGPCARDAELRVIVNVVVETMDVPDLWHHLYDIPEFSYWQDSSWLREDHQLPRGVCQMWYSGFSRWARLCLRPSPGLGEDQTSLKEVSAVSQTESAPLLSLALCSP